MEALSLSFINHIREIERIRQEQDVVIRKINKINFKLSQTPAEKAAKFSEKLWIKLKGFYVEARQLADSEENLCGKCAKEFESYFLTKRKKSDNADQKRNRLKVDDSDNASLTGSREVPSQQIRQINDEDADDGALAHVNVNDQVAALITSDDSLKDDWIVVKVTSIDKKKNLYEVIDEEPGEEEEHAEGRTYILPPSHILLLPKQSKPFSFKEFSIGNFVLAVYPNTTALYRAKVVGLQKKRKSIDDFDFKYLLEFDDDEEEGFEGIPHRLVPFFHVVQLPKHHKQ